MDSRREQFVGPSALLDHDGLAQMRERSVIGVGEPNHGSRGAFEARAAFTLELIDNGIVDHIALEAPMEQIEAVNDYIASHDRSHSPVGRLGFWIWRTREFYRFVELLKRRNERSGPRVSITGIDPQVPARSSRTAASFARRLRRSDADVSRLLSLARLRIGSVTARERVVARELLTELRTVARSAQDHDAEAATTWLLTVLEMCSTDPVAATDLREQLMTDALMASRGSGTTVIWAHNGHVARTGFGRPPVAYLGARIGHEIADRYLAVGTFVGRGRFRANWTLPVRLPMPRSPRVMRHGLTDGTLECALDRSLHGETGLVRVEDLHDQETSDTYHARQAGYAISPLTWPLTFHRVAPSSDYDWLLYVPRSTPTTPL